MILDGGELAQLWNERYGQYAHATDGAEESVVYYDIDKRSLNKEVYVVLVSSIWNAYYGWLGFWGEPRSQRGLMHLIS